MKMRMLLLMMMMVTGAQLKVARVKRQSYGGMGGGGGNNYGGNSYGGARAYGGGPALGRANVDVSLYKFSQTLYHVSLWISVHFQYPPLLNMSMAKMDRSSISKYKEKVVINAKCIN